jgi:hypothetical protein
MTESSVYLTTNAQAARAVEMTVAKRAALKEADERSAERRGEVRHVRALDGLGLLYKAGELTDDQHRVGLAYQRAYEACAGLRGRNALNDQPPGDKDMALQATVDAGRLIVKCERCCTTSGELVALRQIVGLGHSVRSQASGRKYREMCDLVVSVLGKMVEARL